MMRFSMVFILFCVLSNAPSSFARTWYVEKNGTGDFRVIQDAVDAASDGDVIEIGPGRFDDRTYLPGGTVIVLLDSQKSLTFIGSGPEATIIGPEEYVDGPNSYGFASGSGPATYRVENMKAVNHDGTGFSLTNDHNEVRDCVIENCHKGVVFYGQTGVVEDCRISFLIQEGWPGSAIAVQLWLPHSEVRNVEVSNYGEAIYSSYSNSEVSISDCRLYGAEFGLVGIDINSGAGATIENCYIQHWKNYGFVMSSAGPIIFRNNVVEDCTGNTGNGVGLQGSQNLTMHDNVISNCDKCFYVGGWNPQEAIYNNHFFRRPGDGWFIKCVNYWPGSPLYVNLGNNYWGTTDTAELDEWILDGNDNSLTRMFINYLPLADGPVSTDNMTLDGVKALYR